MHHEDEYNTFPLWKQVLILNSPPSEFVIRSVISLAPSAKINWIPSNKKLVPIIGINCVRIGLSSHKIWRNSPYGIKANRFKMISSISMVPFVITEAPNGIKLTDLGRGVMEN